MESLATSKPSVSEAEVRGCGVGESIIGCLFEVLYRWMSNIFGLCTLLQKTPICIISRKSNLLISLLFRKFVNTLGEIIIVQRMHTYTKSSGSDGSAKLIAKRRGKCRYNQIGRRKTFFLTFGYLRDHSVRNANNVRPVASPSRVLHCFVFLMAVDGNFGVLAILERLAFDGELSPIFR